MAHSIAWRSSKPVPIFYLILNQLPIKRRGLTEFTYSRYLVPWLCDYKGIALFADADMLVQGDIAELFALKDESAVQVMKHQKRFEWPSLMLFDCAKCTRLTPEYIDGQTIPQNMDWADTIGDLPKEWNHCVGYAEKPEQTPKLIHYTKGIPVWPETKGCDYSDLWWKELEYCNSTVSHDELMGGSVHVQPGQK